MDSLLDLERRRVQLEQNVKELRKSLRYWQLWEAEYEGFKEEISGLGDKAKEKELVPKARKSLSLGFAADSVRKTLE